MNKRPPVIRIKILGTLKMLLLGSRYGSEKQGIKMVILLLISRSRNLEVFM